MSDQFQVSGLERVPSPALLVWPERVQANIARMIELTGSPARLRPHVKTHKMDAVVRLQLDAGIDKFKAATIAEVELCLRAGARDVLMAYPLVGPNRERLVRLAKMHPEAKVAFVAENADMIEPLNAICREGGAELSGFVDFDCGMARTGTASIEAAVATARAISNASHLRFEGVHVYDGQVRAPQVDERNEDWSDAMEPVQVLIDALEAEQLAVPSVVGGGSPTFGFHAGQRDWQCSPGTTLFWDRGYGSAFPDLPFEYAAVVLTRIISKPGENRLCLDLGHKAIASEGPLENRVQLIGLEDARAIGHSEEHLVLEVDDPDRYSIGDHFLGLPIHICPTVALYQEATLIRDGAVTGEAWEVTARNRRLTV